MGLTTSGLQPRLAAVRRESGGLEPHTFLWIVFPNLREPKKFWGVSDLPQIMESQRELNRALSQLSRILELSGNPIAVLENVEESEDIAVRPGAVWNIPEDAKAYLLDLLQGGGVNLHINYIDLLYRTLHDISESPRSAFGGRPWTYILRDAWHELEGLWIIGLVAIGALIGHWLWEMIFWFLLVFALGYIAGHLFWGMRYIPGQKGGRD